MTKLTLAIFVILILATSVILLFNWYNNSRKNRTQQSGYFLIFLWTLFIIFTFNISFFEPVILTKSDIIGKYVIDKNKFPGLQANWQYDNYRLEITSDNQLIFESKIYENHWKKEILPISFSTGYFDLEKEVYCNRKLRVHSNNENHHIIKDNPTLYRKRFNSFYYVFYSEKYGNVFFKKGNWEK